MVSESAGDGRERERERTTAETGQMIDKEREEAGGACALDICN